MATEQGIVTKIEPTGTWVRALPSSSCDGWTAKGSCHAVGGGPEKEVKVINAAGARVGDRIVMNFQTSSLLKVTFMLYVLPILFLIIGAIIGQKLSTVIQINTSISSIIMGFLFFFVTVWIIKSRANKMAAKDQYQPKIIKILK